MLLLTVASPESVLEEIRIIEENKLSDLIGEVVKADDFYADPNYLVLRTHDLKYLESYLQYIQTYGYESINLDIDYKDIRGEG